ncbi:MAG: preprotein translocase subunit SecY [Firmicutes bacterium]|nr:preprotein translocase subunit SecY [Bacillota bacterium]
MLQTLFASFKVKDIRDRLLWICAGFAIFVLSVHVNVPGVNLKVWNQLLEQGVLFQFLGMFTGGALNNFAITAMGITPYINASIIMQLLTVVIPKLHELQKEGGEMGRRKLGQYVRTLTVVLSLFQALMMVLNLKNYKTPGGEGVFMVPTSGFMQFLYFTSVVLALAAGTAFLMWLGNLMTDKGIGNGVSMLIFAGIVLRLPNYIHNTFVLAGVRGAEYYIGLVVFLGVTILLIMGIVMLTQGQRRVPVQYAKRVVGRKVFGGQSTYIPIRVNNAGVISIIFAISIMYLPSTFANFIPPHATGFLGMLKGFIEGIFNPSHFIYNAFYFLLVCFFTYFYSAITFNIVDVADNMKKYGGFIPGIRPGRPTAEYLEKILSRITFISAVSLGLIAVAPTYIMQITNVKTFYLGSTSLLIVVGVALDTMQQIEARMVMRHYQGFMK